MDRRDWKAQAKVCLREAKGGTKRVTLLCLLAVLALLGAEWGLGALAERTAQGGRYLSQAVSAETRAYVLTFLVSLVCQMALVLVEAGYASVALRLSRNESFSPDTLLDGARLWSRCILLYLYISLLLGLWSGLCSLPVSYVLTWLYLEGYATEAVLADGMLAAAAVLLLIFSYRYRTAFFQLLDNPELPVQQLAARARETTRGFRGRLFLLDLSFVPWLLLCALTGGVLLIWKLPYMAAAQARAYEDLLADYHRRQRELEDFRQAQRQRFGPDFR